MISWDIISLVSDFPRKVKVVSEKKAKKEIFGVKLYLWCFYINNGVCDSVDAIGTKSISWLVPLLTAKLQITLMTPPDGL